MALDVTVAGTSSDAYATIAQVDAYGAEVGSSTWSSLNGSSKESYIKRATRAIDRYHYQGWKYDVLTVTAGQPRGQRLQFPREHDLDGVGDPYLPAEVVEACCAVAVALSEGATEGGGSGDAAIKRFKAGTVEVEFDVSEGGVTALTTDEVVRDILGHRMASTVRTI